MAWQSLYDWCMENGERGKQLLYEFGNGNNEQIYENDFGMMQAPQDFAKSSNTKIKWTCRNNNNHVWEAMIQNRTRGSNCPYCSGKRASEENNLLTWCEQNGEFGQRILNEWVGLDENNNKIEMTQISKGSTKKVRWRCSEGHEWLIDANHRTSNSMNGCPICSNKIISEGINDLKTWCLNNPEYKHLLDEWANIDENGNSIKMTEVSRGSHKKVLWRCHEGHEWYARINDRTSKLKAGCRECAKLKCSEISRKALLKVGENDLLTWCNNNREHGEILKREWLGTDEQGNKIEMTEIARASHIKVKWRCSKLHEWYASAHARTSIYKTGCPFCNKIGTSFPEQFLLRALSQVYPNTINRGKFNNIEYDIMITDTTPHVYIEYSAINYHINKLDRDELKASICKENNIRFIQIYAHNGQIETDEDIFDENQIIYKASNNKEEHNQQLTEILQHILNSLGHDISEINIEQAQTEAFNFMHSIEEEDF